MEGKKISFGFMKTKKVEKPVLEEKKDYIECLEEKSIKVVGGEKVEEDIPLVIPMKPNTLINAERLKEIAEKVESGINEVMPTKEEKVETKSEPVEDETLDQMAVRELLQQAKKEVKIEQQEFTVPVPAKPVMDGEKESTLEDYESVPVQDFGMAMLRGMGWSGNKEQMAKYKLPELRPKGLGLGADKVISEKQKKKSSYKDAKGEELAIVKNAFVKIIAGKHSGYYGKVISLDEDNGRVMVDVTMKKETVSLSEFMMQPVTKAEFDKESKVINTDAYEQYKKKEKSLNLDSKNDSPRHSEKKRDTQIDDKGPSSSQRLNDVRDRKQVNEVDRRKDDESWNDREQSKKERSRQDSSDEDASRRKKDSKRDLSSSEDRNDRKTDKYRRDASSSEDRQVKKKTERSKRDSSSEDRGRSSRRKKEKSRRDSSSEVRSRRRKEKDKKYSSNESLDSVSDTEKKNKPKSTRRLKDSSDSGSDTRKKDKRDIDKKRKGKKKKRDRDRSPNYKKHRK